MISLIGFAADFEKSQNLLSDLTELSAVIINRHNFYMENPNKLRSQTDPFHI